VTWKVRAGERSMQGQPYLYNHVFPNFFFHCTTAYNILRHNGVELGKMDFLGSRSYFFIAFFSSFMAGLVSAVFDGSSFGST
jgi:hypothetical protein